jgi:cytochrome b561
VGGDGVGKYSRTAIALHWIIAILIVTNVTLASMSEDLPRAAQAAYMNPHKAIGISILLLSVFRLFWRLTHRPPAEPSRIVGWQTVLGKTVHWLFYFLIIAVPVTGWMMVGLRPGAPPVDFFGLFSLELPFADSKALSGFGHDGHEILTKPLVILIFLHVIGALKHQFADRLPFLQRMWP